MEQNPREPNIDSTLAQNEEEKRREGLIRELQRKRNAMIDQNPLFYHRRTIGKTGILRGKYKDIEDYELYHLMIASTLDERPPKFDFPGEDSIETFLNVLYAKMLPQENRSSSTPESVR